MGYVVTVCRLEYDLQLPCYLVLALRHDTFAYGLGCHPIRTEALRHAVAEFRGNILALQNSPLESVAYQPLCNVHWPADHYALYNRGPLHHVLRQVLTHVLHVDLSATWTSAPTSIVAGGSPLAAVLAVLEANGYRALACDITPIALAECGVSVIRILVPGLIPLHFGHDRLRLGCSRLRESSVDGASQLCCHIFSTELACRPVRQISTRTRETLREERDHRQPALRSGRSSLRRLRAVQRSPEPLASAAQRIPESKRSPRPPLSCRDRQRLC